MSSAGSKKKTKSKKSPGNSSKTNANLPAAGYLLACDVPTKQFIQYLNAENSPDKKFILQDLDSTHLFVKESAREEIEQKVDDWMDNNVYNAVEKVGEDLDMS